MDVKPGHCKSQTHYYSVQIDNSKYEGISLVSLVKVDCSLKIVRNSLRAIIARFYNWIHDKYDNTIHKLWPISPRQDVLNFTLFLSSAKSMRKSPIYDRLHILEYRSSCKRINVQTILLFYNSQYCKNPKFESIDYSSFLVA